MATLVASKWSPFIRRFYEPLRAAGKAPKVARMWKMLTILNAMMKHQTLCRLVDVMDA